MCADGVRAVYSDFGQRGDGMKLIRWTFMLGAFAMMASLGSAQNTSSAYDAAKHYAPNPYYSSVPTMIPNPYQEVERNWFRLPEGMGWAAMDAPGVDSHGNVWAMTRCRQQTCSKFVANEAAVFEFDPSGKYIRSIGQGLFTEPHGLFVDKDDNVWVADVKGNVVVKLSQEGKVLLTLGTKGVMGGGRPDNFLGPANVYVGPNGDIFVADGHAVLPAGGGEWFGYNARVSGEMYAGIVKFSPDGKFIKRWGKLGTGPGEFNVPHNIAMDSQGRVFVSDVGNSRIQIFDQDGKFLDQWKQFGKPNGIFIDKNDVLYVTDSQSVEGLWDDMYSSIGNTATTSLVRRPRLTDIGLESQMKQGIRIGSAKTGEVTAYIPAPSIDTSPFGPVGIPEYLWVDDQGAIYVGEERDHTYRKYVKRVQLPEGEGKQLVERACTACHDFSEFPRVNFDREDWEATVNTMVGGGAPLKKEDIAAVIDYLATNFKGVATPGVAVAGPVKATINEWDVPTPNSMPLGILHSPNSGLTWYTGEFSNVMGRFDPKTQQFKEYHLRPGTNPTSLVEWPMANVRGLLFFIPQAGTFLGEFHPRNGPYPNWSEGDVVEHPTFGSKLLFQDMATNGVNFLSWFTVPDALPPTYSEGSKIGSYRPLTTEIRLTDTLTPNADPYAIAINSDGVPFFTERNSPRLGSVDPNTMYVTEYHLPNLESRPRGITVTPDYVVWYTDYARGCLGRFDPKTGKFSEWASPSGPQSRPDGITNVGNIIWYAETGTKPNMLVRFDPQTEKFQSWPVKAGGGIRHIYADGDGNLWFTRPLANGIAQAVIKEE
jgi:virginiamycin B lyase